MTIEQQVLEKLRQLPQGKRTEVLDFVEFLTIRLRPHGRPMRSLKGLWTDLDVDLSPEDLEGMRREMWGTFPRESI